MITINATGDTTLHTAGKYCPEDILVKVPAGSGGGGGSVETCTLNITVPRTTGVFYMKYDGGEYAEVCETVDSSISIHNVVCNQNIFFVVSTQMNLVINTTGGVTGSHYGLLGYNMIATAMCTSVSGGTINITEENIFPL